MATFKVGCCGFPVAQETYFSTFPAVEVNTSFYNLPKVETAKGWREKAPKGFEYSIKAWQLITHGPDSPTYQKLTHPVPRKREAWYGYFKPTEEVAEAWRKTRDAAEALGASFIVFQTPSAFYNTADHVSNLRKFFNGMKRGHWLLVWEPRGDWDPKIVQRLCKDLDLTHGVDPLRAASTHGGVKYYRLHGKYEGRKIEYDYAYQDAELKKLGALVEGQRAYVFFNNRAMWNDARRFQAMTQSPMRFAPEGTKFGPGVQPFKGGLKTW